MILVYGILINNATSDHMCNYKKKIVELQDKVKVNVVLWWFFQWTNNHTSTYIHIN